MGTTEEQEVKAFIEKFYKALGNKDMKAISRLYAHDDDVVHYGGEGKFVGWEALQSGFNVQFATRSFILTSQALSVHISGNIAWFSDDVHVKGVAGGEPIEGDARLTGVLGKRGSDWVLVQSHTSGATPVIFEPLPQDEREQVIRELLRCLEGMPVKNIRLLCHLSQAL